MLVRAVEAFLKHHDMAATKFGRLAAGDPRFVLDLRLGRIPRPKTEARTRGWMAEYEVAARKAARQTKPAKGKGQRPILTVPAPRPSPKYTAPEYAAGAHSQAVIKETAHV